MAKRLFERRDGQVPPTISLWDNPRELTEAEFDEVIAQGEELLALSEDAYNAMGAYCPNLPTKEEIQAQVDNAKDKKDFFDYDKVVHTMQIADGSWFEMIAVESFCGEETGFEAVLAIDGQTSTWWQHDADEAHEIVFQLRDYSKRVEKIRIRRGGNDRSELTDIDIYVANSIGGLDEPSNLAVSGATLPTVSDWNEVDFTNKQRGQYIRLTGFGSVHSGNEVRIREIEAWVTTTPLNG